MHIKIDSEQVSLRVDAYYHEAAPSLPLPSPPEMTREGCQHALAVPTRILAFPRFAQSELALAPSGAEGKGTGSAGTLEAITHLVCFASGRHSRPLHLTRRLVAVSVRKAEGSVSGSLLSLFFSYCYLHILFQMSILCFRFAERRKGSEKVEMERGSKAVKEAKETAIRLKRKNEDPSQPVITRST